MTMVLENEYEEYAATGSVHLYPKWLYSDCGDIDAMIKAHENEISYLKSMKEKGWAVSDNDGAHVLLDNPSLPDPHHEGYTRKTGETIWADYECECDICLAGGCNNPSCYGGKEDD